jgi:hypothetical protein
VKKLLLLIMFGFSLSFLNAMEGDPINIDGSTTSSSSSAGVDLTPGSADLDPSADPTTDPEEDPDGKVPGSSVSPDKDPSSSLLHPDSDTSPTSGTGIISADGDTPADPTESVNDPTVAPSTTISSDANSVLWNTEKAYVTKETGELLQYLDIQTQNLTETDLDQMEALLADLKQHVQMHAADQAVINNVVDTYIKKQISDSETVEEVDEFLDEITNMNNMASNFSTAIMNGLKASRKMALLRIKQLKKQTVKKKKPIIKMRG